jgi:hypothetical protein
VKRNEDSLDIIQKNLVNLQKCSTLFCCTLCGWHFFFVMWYFFVFFCALLKIYSTVIGHWVRYVISGKGAWAMFIIILVRSGACMLKRYLYLYLL